MIDVTIRDRIRGLLLPVAQLALAAVLVRWSQTLTVSSRCDMPGPDPAFLLMISISAPVNLVRIFLDLWLPYPWNLAAWLGGVGLFWHRTRQMMERRLSGRRIVRIRSRAARLSIDSGLVAMGALFVLMGMGELKMEALRYRQSDLLIVGCFGPNWRTLLLALITSVFHLGWGVVFMTAFGRDFTECLRETQ
jgi:hypothetical protein